MCSHSAGPGGSGWPGSGPLVGAAPDGAPLPPATPAMSAIGAPGSPPSAISGAPAGTATGSGAPAPAGIGSPPGMGAPAGIGSPPGMGAPPRTGAPAGSGAATGAPAMSVIGAPAGTQAGPAPAAPAAPPAPAAPAAAGAPTSPAAPYMHAPPPVFNGEAPASGLSTIAAPHNPTPATTLMPNRSVIDVNSPYHGQAGARRSTPVQPHRDRDSHGQPIFNRPVSKTHHAAPERFQIETFSLVWRSAETRTSP